MLGWRRPLSPQPACAVELKAFLQRPFLEESLATLLPCPVPDDQALWELLHGLLEVHVAARWSTAMAVEAPWLVSGGQGAGQSSA
mmetsp:Transcript_1581/g.4836  ORF Transcript_1581/g.4836 Transcript_1581/m.4836 type:complete len:85 (+) Transcript_1581:1-255(+)